MKTKYLLMISILLLVSCRDGKLQNRVAVINGKKYLVSEGAGDTYFLREIKEDEN